MSSCGLSKMTSPDALIKEVESIISVPYHVPLKVCIGFVRCYVFMLILLQRLNHILDGLITQKLQVWTTVKSCQIAPLLENLRARSQAEPVAVDVFLKLSTSQCFLKALLSKDSALFETICSHLLEALQRKHEDCALSMWARHSFLSIVLPKRFSAPTAYLKVLGIILGPTRDTLHPSSHQILTFLASVSVELISSLDDVTLDNCHQHWKAALRSQDNGDVVQSLHLASCFQSNAKTDSSPEASAKSSQPLSPNLVTWVDKCRMRFSQAEVDHVIQRTVLSVLKWCSEAAQQDASAVSSVKLAASLLHNVDVAHLRNWVSSNGPIMRKLSQKLTMPELSADLRAQGVVVLSVLDDDCKCPKWIILASRVAHDLTTGSVLDTCDDVDALQPIISRLIYVLDQGRPWSSTDGQRHQAQILKDLVTYVLAACQPRDKATVATFDQIEMGILLVKAVKAGGHDLPGSSLGAFLHALCEVEVPEWWPLDLSSPDHPGNCASLNVCVHEFEAKRQELCLLVTSTAIRTASLSANTVTPATFDLLQRRLGTPERKIHCRYPDPFRALPMQQVARIDDVSSLHWREQLQRQLVTRSHESANLVEHYVVLICQDLQSRCDNVESPLREALADAQELKNGLVQIRADLAQSERERELLGRSLDEEGRKHVINAEKATSLASEVVSLQAEVSDQKREIRDLEDRAENRATEHRRYLNGIGSSHESELASMQQQLDSQRSTFEEQLYQQRNALTESVEEARWLREHLDQTTVKLRSEHTEAVQKLSDEMSTAEAAAQGEIQRLNVRAASREVDVDRLQQDLYARDQELTSANEQHERDKSTLGSLQLDLEAVKASVQDVRSHLDVEVRSHATLREKEAKRSVDLNESLSRIAQLERSESALREQCGNQDKALKKAQRAEASVLAILQNARQPVESPVMSTKTASPSQQTATPTPRLLQGSFVSEEDADYSDFMRLGDDASRRRRTSVNIR